jgi:Spy/CpxP family protein refolding chaperone
MSKGFEKQRSYCKGMNEELDSQKRRKATMKRFLIIGIPLAIVAILVTAQLTHSFGFHRRHHGMAKDFAMYRLDKMSKELNLTPAQQAKMDTFKTDLSNIIDQRMEKKKEVREMIKAELAKPNPDISKIQPLIDQQIDELAQIGHQMVGRIGEFYNDLTPEQKKMISDHILERMDDDKHFED